MISMEKQYKTRDGRDVRILCVDGPNSAFPVIGFIEGLRFTSSWEKDGLSGADAERSTDLIEVKKTKVVKSLCWRFIDGDLVWRDKDWPNAPPNWKRFPAGDREGEIEVEQ